jgi:hypothetical protein
MLTIGGGKLEAHWLLVPTMDVLGGTNTASKPFVELPKMNPEVQTVGSHRETEIQLPNHFKPPDLLKVCHRLEPARAKWVRIGSDNGSRENSGMHPNLH